MTEITARDALKAAIANLETMEAKHRADAEVSRVKAETIARVRMDLDRQAAHTNRREA